MEDVNVLAKLFDISIDILVYGVEVSNKISHMKSGSIDLAEFAKSDNDPVFASILSVGGSPTDKKGND